MPARLVALDEGPDIPLDRAMIVVGRHPQCDARLDSLRVSRHHCCMTQDHGEVVVRDLGSTNGIRINGQRVEFGRLRPGDELSIAHIRYRLDSGQGHDATVADTGGARSPLLAARPRGDLELRGREFSPPLAARPMSGTGAGFPYPPPPVAARLDDRSLAAALQKALPSDLAKHYQIQVILQKVDPVAGTSAEGEQSSDAPAARPESEADAGGSSARSGSEKLEACRPDSSH